MESVERKRQIVGNVLTMMEFYSYPDSFLKMLLSHLELDDRNKFDKDAAIDRIIFIYEQYNQRYQIYLQKPTFKNILPDVKDFLRNVFKKYDEKLNYQIKDNFPNRQPSFFYDEPNKFNPLPNTHMNMNMNLSNTFLQIPNNMTPEEIEVFQRKMYQVCKNAMPQILNSLPSNQPNIYSNVFSSMFPPYSFNNFSKPQLYSPQPQFNRMNNNMPKYATETNTLGKMGFLGGNKNFPSNFQTPHTAPNTNFNQPFFRTNQTLPFIQPEEQPDKKYYVSQKNNINQIKKDDYQSLDKFEHQQSKKKVKKDYQSLEKQVPSKKVIKCICENENNDLCIYCELKKLNRFHKIKQSIQVRSSGNAFHCQVSAQQVSQYVKDSQHNDIEIRFMKIDEEGNMDTEWPDGSIIWINDEKEMQIKSGSQNPQKNKKKKPFLFSKNLEDKELNPKETIKIKVQLKQNNDRLGVGVYLIQKLPLSEVYQLLKEQIQIIQMKEEFKDQEQEYIEVSPYDPITKDLMKDPVKGRNCYHSDCFDLKDFLSVAKRSRNWKCSICNEQVTEMVLNGEIQSINQDIERMIKQPKLIRFHKNGHYSLRYDDDKGK